MSLSHIDATGLRNLEPTSIEPHPRLNFLVGPNASGKTSLLEAAYLLGRARSFRTHQINQLIHFGDTALTVVGKLSAQGSSVIPVGIRLGRGEREIHLAGKAIQSSAELIRALPLLVIQPSGIALLEGAPRLRRQFLDFGVFHQDSSYLDHWRRYTKALNQRNALLRAQSIRDIAPWNHELARCGIMINDARTRYIERMEPFFQEVGGRFFSSPRFVLRLHAGWDLSRSLDSILEHDVASDLRHGYTQAGPHKGDFSITLDGRPVKAYLSRGQMKLLVYALLLAQARLMEEHNGGAGCVLIDDVASELDDANRRTLLTLLQERSTQYFITATSRHSIEEGLQGDSALFDITQGRITQTRP